MKNFNKQIQITVELDSIAQSLLSTMNPEEKHRELIVEAIIGRLDANEDKTGMTLLYNALNGHKNEINFKEGDEVICEDTVYGYWTPQSIESGSRERRAIGKAVVKRIDLYHNEKIVLEYQQPQKNGTFNTEEYRTHHSNCKKIALKEVDMSPLAH